MVWKRLVGNMFIFDEKQGANKCSDRVGEAVELPFMVVVRVKTSNQWYVMDNIILVMYHLSYPALSMSSKLFSSWCFSNLKNWNHLKPSRKLNKEQWPFLVVEHDFFNLLLTWELEHNRHDSFENVVVCCFWNPKFVYWSHFYILSLLRGEITNPNAKYIIFINIFKYF